MTKTKVSVHRSFTYVLFTTLISSTIVVSCTRRDETTTTKADVNSPAYQIAQSEKISIPDAVELPSNLPNGNTRVATFSADGVQKYKAQAVAGSNPVTYQWVFVAPQADLYDVSNNKVGTHSAGPDWQISAADSMFGQSFTPARTSPGTDANSIDWLLLMPKTGKAATGLFANVSYVQRIVTKGGKAPVDPPASLTDVADVRYTAIYRFTKQNQ